MLSYWFTPMILSREEYRNIFLIVWLYECLFFYLMTGCAGNCHDLQESASQRDVWCPDGGPGAATDCSEFESTGLG